MEIEHINEDTIRVRIENSDLEARGYTFLDLLGNQKHIETFFYSILEEVDIDEEFQESDAVTFQIMPNRNGLELFISKNADMHDNLFAHMDIEGLDEDDLESETGFQPFEKYKNFGKPNREKSESPKIEPDNQKIVVEFSTFEQIIELARIFQIEAGFTNLYQYTDRYFLEMSFLNDEFSLRTPQEEKAIVLEFGLESKISADVLIEHGQVIIEDVALETIRHYFN